MEKVEIYVMTHKKIIEPYDKSLYKPIVNGSFNSNQDWGYIRDDSGDNISHLHDNYGELTSEYWVWKNSNADIIGFCHYRRWFVKKFKWKKITKSDIIRDLNEYDIILPHNVKYHKSLYDIQKESDILTPNYDAAYEDYLKVEEVLKNFFPDYAKYYHDVMNGKILWPYTLFISKREIADEYFKWLFDVLNELNNSIDLNKYASRDKRVFAFISERLFTTYIIKNNLKVKEYDIYNSDRKLPLLEVINSRFPYIRLFEQKIMRKTIKKNS